jgi:hypothetical protein
VEKLIPLLEQQTQTLLECGCHPDAERSRRAPFFVAGADEKRPILSVRLARSRPRRERETKDLRVLAATHGKRLCAIDRGKATRLRAVGDALRQAVLKLKSKCRSARSRDRAPCSGIVVTRGDARRLLSETLQAVISEDDHRLIA